ncbi:MAG: hypothetical protein M1834_008805 [Cirrosporium novae-zelandiae]|nr:MAG: hypothetical protein M1834_008805 [Cirrosporium novae-zelandiae]
MSKSQFLSTSLPSQRPYRSHKNPACDRCRKRKLRCVVDLPGQPCLLCRLNLSVCDHGSINSKAQDANDTELSSPQRASKRRRQAPEDPTLQLNENVSTVITTCNRQIEGLDAKTDSADSSIVVGPMVAEDVRIFQQCLPSSPSIGSQQSQPYNIVSDDPRNPILYLKVPRRREGLKLAKSPGKAQLEILEQILGPYTHELIAMYSDHAPR